VLSLSEISAILSGDERRVCTRMKIRVRSKPFAYRYRANEPRQIPKRDFTQFPLPRLARGNQNWEFTRDSSDNASVSIQSRRRDIESFDLDGTLVARFRNFCGERSVLAVAFASLETEKFRKNETFLISIALLGDSSTRPKKLRRRVRSIEDSPLVILHLSLARQGTLTFALTFYLRDDVFFSLCSYKINSHHSYAFVRGLSTDWIFLYDCVKRWTLPQASYKLFS